MPAMVVIPQQTTTVAHGTVGTTYLVYDLTVKVIDPAQAVSVFPHLFDLRFADAKVAAKAEMAKAKVDVDAMKRAGGVFNFSGLQAQFAPRSATK